MEKTIQIIIAKTTFSCTQGAFDRLSSYLDQMKNHFAHEEGSEEIMHDIESRIAEKLLEQNKELITLIEVETVIADIGEVSELDDDTPDVEMETEKLPRRLYRDTDNAIIGGIAYGMATYFNTSPIFIRLFFIISVLFGGTGIVLYLLLWIVIPEARTSAQKLEMRGIPVTFEAIRSMVQTRTGASSTFLQRIPLYARAIMTKTLNFFGTAFGVLTLFGSFFGIIALTIFAGVVLTNWNSPLNDIPFREASSTLLLLVTIVAGYIVALIPLIFAFILGVRLLRAKAVLSTTVGFGLMGIWALALIVAGTTSFKIANDYYTHVQTDPAYETHLETQSLEAFDHIVIEGATVQITNGDEYQAIVEGRRTSIDRVQFTVENGTLTVRREAINNNCLFCNNAPANVIISVPSLQTANANEGRIGFEDYQSDESLVLNINDGSVYGDLEVDELSIINKNGSMRANVTAHTLILEGARAWFDLRGAVETATLSLVETSLNANTLIVQDAVVEMIESDAYLTVRGLLTKTIDRESNLQVKGQTLPVDEEDLDPYLE